MLSVVTLNIGAAALDRACRIAQWLEERDDDVVVLTETSNGPGTAWLLDAHRRAGYRIVHTASPDGDRGVAIATRIPEAFASVLLTPTTLPHRLAIALLDTTPQVAVVGVYVPSRDRTAAKTAKKRDFTASLLDALAGLPADARNGLMLAGDYNVIDRTHTPRHRGFCDFELDFTDQLASLGLRDAFAVHAPGVQEHSWIGRTGEGYRYDYIHLGAALASVIDSCAYLHHTRHRKLSDHAAVSLRLDVAVKARLDVAGLFDPGLF